MQIFLRILGLLRKYWPWAVLAYFCLLASAGFSLAIPRLTGLAIDLALARGAVQTLALIALGIIAVSLLRAAFSYGQNYLAEFISQRVAYDLRNAFYDHLQRLSFAFHDRSQTGQLMSRATVDVEGVRMFVGFALFRAAYFLLLLVAIAFLLFFLNWQLAFLGLAALPLISYRGAVVGKRLRPLWQNIQQGMGVLGTILQENLAGVRVVRAFAREDFESQKFQGQAQTLYRQEMEAARQQAFNSPLMAFLLLLAMGIILWFGGREVIQGRLTTGEMAQFLLYLLMLNMPVRMIGWLLILYSRAFSSAQRIFEVLDAVSPVQDKPGARELVGVRGEVRFQGVSFSYDARSPVLQDIGFEARPGQVVALVGTTGGGKSTIANLIPRFYDVTSGGITIDGVDIREATLASLRRNIGIVHQDIFLFSATIRDNIAYGRVEASEEEIVAAAKVARLHDFITSLPQGYQTWVGERGITLSGGQKQRVAIARVLLLDPRILILDDSTSSVDMETDYLIQQALAELLPNRTTFIIAQRLRSVQMADLILVLKGGRIVERGRHAELLARDGFYRELYQLQFRDQEAPQEAGLSRLSPRAEGRVS